MKRSKYLNRGLMDCEEKYVFKQRINGLWREVSI